MKPIVQERGSGCAIACVASLLGITYKKAARLFRNKRAAISRGYYCREICYALRKAGKHYCYQHISGKNRKLLKRKGIIVFVKRNKKYPLGHYLLKAGKGWMNPWINYPNITPAKAGFQVKLPGGASYIIFPFVK